MLPATFENGSTNKKFWLEADSRWSFANASKPSLELSSDREIAPKFLIELNVWMTRRNTEIIAAKYYHVWPKFKVGRSAFVSPRWLFAKASSDKSSILDSLFKSDSKLKLENIPWGSQAKTALFYRIEIELWFARPESEMETLFVFEKLISKVYNH